MPLVVAMLENLEQAMRDRQRLEVDAEMLRVDNEQLIGQYEKERGMRRNAEQVRRVCLVVECVRVGRMGLIGIFWGWMVV